MNKIENINHFINSPGFSQMARDKIKEFDGEIHAEKMDLDRQYKRRSTSPPHEIWLLDSIIESTNQCIEVWQKEKRRFQYLLDRSLGKERKGSFDIEQIKQIPIDTILGAPKWTSGNRAKYLCPLHEESNPSFVWYKDQNSFHCYGCGTGGSIVDLYMKMNGCDFRTACKSLST